MKLAFSLLLIHTAAAWAADIFALARQGDYSRLKAALDAGLPANARDENGTPLLMLAAVYGDARVLQLLLDRGADPNATDSSGANALVWGSWDLARTRLLIERGADVNAVTTKGRSAVLTAAGRPGNSAVVAYLLRKGANAKQVDKSGESLLHRAAYSGDIQTIRLVLKQGLNVNSADEYGWTPLMEVALQQSAEAMKLLLSHKANPSAVTLDGTTALLNFGSFASYSTYDMLFRAGADLRHRDKLGRTLLIAAAASDSTPPNVVERLIAAGLEPKLALPNLGRTDGESALDWAAKRGDTPVTRMLAKAAGVEIMPPTLPALTRLRASSTREALTRSLPLLAASGPEFMRRSGCVSCHHQALPLAAFGLAGQHGVRVDETAGEKTRAAILSVLKPAATLFLQDVRLPGGATTAGYLLFGLHGAGYEADFLTDAIVHWLAVNQTPNGSWRVEADRPPMEYSHISSTALAIVGLSRYGFPGRAAEMRQRIDRARNWLLNARAATNEERIFRLLGMYWAKADPMGVKSAADDLLQMQRPDGGWGQLETLESDAYATGQALYALHSAKRLTSGSPEFQKGVRYLLDTQLQDGSWFVRSRSYPIQPKYFDTGFPHGVNQWISAAGSAWVSLALALTL